MVNGLCAFQPTLSQLLRPLSSTVGVAGSRKISRVSSKFSFTRSKFPGNVFKALIMTAGYANVAGELSLRIVNSLSIILIACLFERLDE